jgi:hypothetical protein
MTGLVWFRAWRALVVTLSAVTLAQLLELSQRLAYDVRLWAQLTTPDPLYRYLASVGGPLQVATVVGVTALAVTVGSKGPAGRLALAAAALHTAALGVWLRVVLPANGSGAAPSDWERWRIRWELGHTVSFGLLLFGFAALVLAVLSERHPRQVGRFSGAGGIG